MRTSLNEIREVERFLHNEMTTGESLVFQARMITSRQLRVDVAAQKRLMELFNFYHRRKIKSDLRRVHSDLMHLREKSDFQILIRGIFHPDV